MKMWTSYSRTSYINQHWFIISCNSQRVTCPYEKVLIVILFWLFTVISTCQQVLIIMSFACRRKLNHFLKQNFLYSQTRRYNYHLPTREDNSAICKGNINLQEHFVLYLHEKGHNSLTEDYQSIPAHIKKRLNSTIGA